MISLSRQPLLLRNPAARKYTSTALLYRRLSSSFFARRFQLCAQLLAYLRSARATRDMILSRYPSSFTCFSPPRNFTRELLRIGQYFGNWGTFAVHSIMITLFSPPYLKAVAAAVRTGTLIIRDNATVWALECFEVSAMFGTMLGSVAFIDAIVVQFS